MVLTKFQGAQTGSQVLLGFSSLVFLPTFGSISALVILGIKLHGRQHGEWQKTQGELCPGRPSSPLLTPLGMGAT